MKKKFVVEVEINLDSKVFISFDSFIEISMDCFICQRKLRTIILKHGEEKARCIKKNHVYPAKIVELKRTENKVEYHVEYDYRQFEDERNKMPSDDNIKWARVYFKIECPNCNKQKDCSVQTNTIRPWSCYCKCGQLLYTEQDEMPIIKKII